MPRIFNLREGASIRRCALRTVGAHGVTRPTCALPASTEAVRAALNFNRRAGEIVISYGVFHLSGAKDSQHLTASGA